MKKVKKDQSRIRFKLSPALTDGVNVTILDSPDDVVEAVKVWAYEACRSDCSQIVKIQLVSMTDKEYASLKEI